MAAVDDYGAEFGDIDFIHTDIALEGRKRS